MSQPSPPSPPASGKPTELTESALNAHNRATSDSGIVHLPPAHNPSSPKQKRPRHRIILPTAHPSTPGPLMGSRHWATPAAGQTTPTRNPSSYFQMTHAPLSSTAVAKAGPKPTLTPSQSRAHAMGYSPTSSASKFFPLPSPPKSEPTLSPTPPLRQDASAFQRIALQTIAESSSNGSSRSASNVGGPSLSQRRRNRSTPPIERLPDFGASKPSRKTLTPGAKATHPYFSWTPGAVPPPIFDPDYPQGSPSCITPRSKDTPSSPLKPKSPQGYFENQTLSNRDGDRSPLLVKESSSSDPTSSYGSSYTDIPLTMSELSIVHQHVGSIRSVFGHLPDVSLHGSPTPTTIPWQDMHRFFSRVQKERAKGKTRSKRSVTLPATSECTTDVATTDASATDDSISPPTSEEPSKGTPPDDAKDAPRVATS